MQHGGGNGAYGMSSGATVLGSFRRAQHQMVQPAAVPSSYHFYHFHLLSYRSVFRILIMSLFSINLCKISEVFRFIQDLCMLIHTHRHIIMKRLSICNGDVQTVAFTAYNIHCEKPHSRLSEFKGAKWIYEQ